MTKRQALNSIVNDARDFGVDMDERSLLGSVDLATVTASGGSTPRTLADWMATPAVDIRKFGVIYDDDATKDDLNTDVFQAALDSAERVLVPAGRFYLNTLTMVSGSQLVGVGRPNQFQFNPTTGTTLDFLNAPVDSDGLSAVGAAVQMIYLADMQISRAPRHGANLQTVYSAIERVSFAYNGTDGLHLINAYLTSIRNCLFELNGGDGFNATATSQYTTLMLDNCESIENTGNGYHISDHNSTSIASGGADRNGGYGYEIVDAEVNFNATDAERNDKSGYYGSASLLTFTNCTSATNVEDEGAGEANFLRATGSKVVLIGCHDLALDHSTISVNIEGVSEVFESTNTWLGTVDIASTATTASINAGIFAGNKLTILNKTDAASVQVARIEGDSATPANNDEIYQSYYMSDDAGAQNEIARLTIRTTNVAAASLQSVFRWAVMITDTLTDELQLTSGALHPVANAGLALGVTGGGYSNLFLSTGAFIDWASANARITHSTGQLTSSVPFADPTGNLQAIPRSTTAALAAIGNAINTTNKFAGKVVINTTSGAIVTANGATAAATWLALDGTTAHTPV